MIKSEKYIRYNANSKNRNVGDCVKRGISLAYGMDYNKVSSELNAIKREINAPKFNSIKTIDEFIDRHGGSDFVRIDNKDERLTEEEFSQKYNTGTYLCLTGSSKDNPNITHLVCIHNGNIYDSWDSSNYYVKRYYKIHVDSSIENATINEFDDGTRKKFASYIELCIDEAYKKYSEYYQSKGWDFENCRLVLNDARLSRGNIVADIEVSYTGPLKGVTDNYWNNAYRYELQIPYVLNPRFSEDEIYEQIEKLTDNYIERKLCWWIIDSQKEATKYKDSYERRGTQRGHFSYYDGRDKKVFLALPLWVRNLTKSFDVDNGRLWGEKPEYTLELSPLASDTTHEDSVYFYGQNSKEIMSYVNDYIKDPNNYNDSYDNYA